MTIEERLEKLERELDGARRRNRRLLTVVGLLAAGAGLVWLFTKTPVSAAVKAAAPKEVRAGSFIVVDEKDNPRIMLMVNKGGTALIMMDENKIPRIGMGITKDGPGLDMYDEKGKIIWGSR